MGMLNKIYPVCSPEKHAPTLWGQTRVPIFDVRVPNIAVGII